jgi:hypothetical protein
MYIALLFLFSLTGGAAEQGVRVQMVGASIPACRGGVLAAQEARSERRVEYQDDEARKPGRG